MLEADPDAAVYLGFSRDVEAAELTGWARDQDVEAMLGVTGEAGGAGRHLVQCPAGTPHAISEGILVVELQEPADLSIMLEWSTFSLTREQGTLDSAGGGAGVHRPPGLPAGAAEGAARPVAEQRRGLAAARRSRPVLRRRTGRHAGQQDISRRATACSWLRGRRRPPGHGGRLVPDDRAGQHGGDPAFAGPAVLSGGIEGVRCLPASMEGRPGRPAAWARPLPTSVKNDYPAG